MSHKEYVYCGEPVPPLTNGTHEDFLLLLQEAILYALEKRKLLTGPQREQCITALERRLRAAGQNTMERSGKTVASISSAGGRGTQGGSI